MCGLNKPTPADKKREDEYRAEDDLRTITRAEEIRADTGRMAGLRKIQRKQLRALSQIGRAIGNAPMRRSGRKSTR